MGRLNGGKRLKLVAQTFNCNVSTNQRPRKRYNTTDSIKDRARCGHP
jgi:hypothetical protein